MRAPNIVAPTFQSVMPVYPVVLSVGATPPLVFHVTATEDQVMVNAEPSSTIRVIDCPVFQVPAVGVDDPVNVQVCTVPLVGDRAGVVLDGMA
jgi:hypothetical protein